MTKFLLIIFIFFFNQKLLLAEIDKKNEWAKIDKYDSYIIVNSNIVLNNKINQYPIYEKLIKWEERDMAHGEIYHWLHFYDGKNFKNKICKNICFDISYYEVEKSTWIADIYPSYSPKKSIKYFYNDKEDLYKFTSKLNGFKSIEKWISFRKFIDFETNQNCFIFGAQWHHGYEFPYAILDGIFCKSKELTKNDFTIDEIKKIVNNIGIKKIRKIPSKPRFILSSKNDNIKVNKSKYIYCKDNDDLNVYDYLNLRGSCYDDQIEITKDQFLNFNKQDDELNITISNLSLEDKLTKLKNLFDQKLITKNEYDAKRKEILDSF